jgi:hypothetical protein
LIWRIIKGDDLHPSSSENLCQGDRIATVPSGYCDDPLYLVVYNSGVDPFYPGADVRGNSGLSEPTKTLLRSTGISPAAKTISTGMVEVRPIVDEGLVGWAKYLGLH